MIAAHLSLDHERDARDRAFLINALDMVFAKWHGDKQTSKLASRALGKILTKLTKEP